jgi:integrase/recombinase XerC
VRNPNGTISRAGGTGAGPVRGAACALRQGDARQPAAAAVMPWAAETVAQYLEEVRPHYGCDRHPAVRLTERGGRISPRQIDDRFAQFRRLAHLPDDPSVHSLRHSYVSHFIEDQTDPLFVQQQVGHSWASTTAVYTTVGADARNRMLRAALARAFDRDRDGY